MKPLFSVIFIILCLVSALWYAALPSTQNEAPTLYWVSDNNPARAKQLDAFEHWRERKELPPMHVELDANNGGPDKIIIQGVSGIAGDLLQFVSGFQLRFFSDVGILQDQTQAAHELGFDLSNTYASVAPEIISDGKQFAYPCNVLVKMLVINKDTFAKYDIDLPPMEMTLDDFERLGKEFVAKANQDKEEHERVFFCNWLEAFTLRRSAGVSKYNETLTACTLDDPRYAKILDRLEKWRSVDRLLPTAADKASMTNQSVFGGSVTEMFASGRYAMIFGGRFNIVGFRERGITIDLTAVEIPHAGFPNTSLMCRSTAVYKNSPYPKLASLFLAYLASEEYNMTIVEDGDGLPPNPKYTELEEFHSPKDYPNEWDFHHHFARLAQTRAIGLVFCPFLDDTFSYNADVLVLDMFEQGELTSEEATREVTRRINEEIERTIDNNPALKEEYHRRLKVQAEIDALKAEGKKIPASLIENHFLKRYYAVTGQLDETR